MSIGSPSRPIGTAAVIALLHDAVIVLGLFSLLGKWFGTQVDTGFITALLLLMRPLRQLTGINAVIQKGLAAGESVFSLLDQPEESDGGAQRL